jgi:hypothetical protein
LYFAAVDLRRGIHHDSNWNRNRHRRLCRFHPAAKQRHRRFQCDRSLRKQLYRYADLSSLSFQSTVDLEPAPR